MSTKQNKQLLEDVFARLAAGDGEAFVDAMADDVRWTLTGDTPWSRTYAGKQAVRDELLAPLFAQFADQYTNVAQSFTADEDRVVVEARGHVTTTAGKPYENTYCFVFRLADGKVAAITEYFDTQLVATALAPPA